MKLNIVVSSEMYDALCQAIKTETWSDVTYGNSNKSFVNVRRIKLVEPLDVEIELEIEESSTSKPPGRQEIDKLWDIFGIFPRVEPAATLDRLTHLLEEAQETRKKLRAALTDEYAGGPPSRRLAFLDLERALNIAMIEFEKMWRRAEAR